MDAELQQSGEALASRLATSKGKLGFSTPSKLSPFLPLIQAFAMRKLFLFRKGATGVPQVTLLTFLKKVKTCEPSDLVAVGHQERLILDQYNPNDFKLILPLIEQILAVISEEKNPILLARTLIEKAKLLRYVFKC